MTGRLTVVASVMSPDSSITAARAAGPSSQGPAEEQVVVRAEVAVPQAGGRPGVGLEAAQGRRRVELDQGEVGAVLHAASVPHGSGGLAAPAPEVLALGDGGADAGHLGRVGGPSGALGGRLDPLQRG